MVARKMQMSSPPPLQVTVGTSGLEDKRFEFTELFRIGRTEECEICVKDEHVSRIHAEVSFENGTWQIRDLGSTNGLYSLGQRLERISIIKSVAIRLGIEGPEVRFQVEPPAGKDEDLSPNGAVIARYVEHYFGNSNEPVGEHTMFVREAFARVQTRQKRKHGFIVGALVFCIVAAGTYAIYERQQVKRQRAMAEDLFYAMKSMEVDIAKLESAAVSSNNPEGIEEIRKYEKQRKDTERNYNQFLATLHVYNPKMTEQEKLVMRVARVFGECELDMPPDFMAEVSKYIKLWQSSGRFARAINVAKKNNYTSTISQEFLAQGLPPQFFYLALQESDFDPYISGPLTRKGIAKGMWQFIPETAIKYGLHLGPLVDLRRPDPGDDRHHYDKETKAAVSYIKDLYSTDAQASGLLVMACYNWGENSVLPLVRSMPANPRDRNFWRLLAQYHDKIPQQTYDYVFYIVSAAVIGENPRLFGFDFDNPLADLESKDTPAFVQNDFLADDLLPTGESAERIPFRLPRFGADADGGLPGRPYSCLGPCPSKDFAAIMQRHEAVP
jgi:membrane-bound lytic murein transglycosylase D